MTSSEFEVKKIKWLETAKTKKGIIAQLDPDGLYSAFIISRLTGLDVVGVSDLYNNIYGIDENDKLSDYVFVDVEMFLPDVLSVGNHNNITSPKVYEEIKDRLVNCLNPNYQFGVTVKEYTGKYPFGTAHYLIELYSEELNLPELFESKELLQLLYISDAVYNTVNKYPTNFKNWADKLFKNDLFQDKFLKVLFKKFSFSKDTERLLNEAKKMFGGYEFFNKRLNSKNIDEETRLSLVKEKLNHLSLPFQNLGMDFTKVNMDKNIKLNSHKYGGYSGNELPEDITQNPASLYKNVMTINYTGQNIISLTYIPKEIQNV
jgi:hypothetical protein